MSRLRHGCASAAVTLGGALVILATSCTNDFDGLFQGDNSSGSSGATDSGKPNGTSSGSNEEICTGNCAADQSTSDVGRKFVCPTCSTCTCLVECSDKDKACGGTCRDGAFCDVQCAITGTCTLTCESGAGCLLRCGKGDCSLDCKGGTRETCPDGTLACNATCPK